MISVKLPFSDEDRSEYKALLLEKFPNATLDATNAQINALIDSRTVLANAIYHLSMYYVIGYESVISQLKQEKSRFWLYTLESLYDSGVMFLCGLFDEDKKLSYKNIRTIEKCYPMLKNKDIKLVPLPKFTEQIYKRLKCLRDKRLAHYEYSAKIKSQYYDDPAKLCNITYKYLQMNERIIFNAEIDTGSLSEIIHRNATGICNDIGVKPIEKHELSEMLEYIDKLGLEE